MSFGYCRAAAHVAAGRVHSSAVGIRATGMPLFVQHPCRRDAQAGWSVLDAFGINLARPGVAVHNYGLGVLVGAGRVIEMTDTFARIELVDGGTQSFTRKPMDGAVPIWTVWRRHA